MDVAKRLVMNFKTNSDKNVSLSIDDPRENLTEAEIKSVMDLIIAKNLFSPEGSTLVEAVGAKVVVTDTTEYDLV